MRLAILSDFHLSPEPGVNRCTTPPEQLSELLGGLLSCVDRVVVAGDAFDLLRPRRLRGWRDQLTRLHLRWPELMRAYGRCDAVWGNHDRPLAALRVPEEAAYHAGGESLLVTHGHQWDIWLKRIWGAEEGANFAAGWFERAGLHGVSTWMGDVPEVLDALGISRVAYRRWVSSLIDVSEADAEDVPRHILGAKASLEQGWSVVASGHSHNLELVPMSDGLFLNTGSHTHGHRDVSLIDLEAGVAIARRDGRTRQIAARRQGEAGRRWALVASPHDLVAPQRAAFGALVGEDT